MKFMKSRNLLYVLVGAAVLIVIALGLRMYATTEKEAFSSGQDTFTLYYADWCPHCKAVKPVFSEWSSSGTVMVQNKTVVTKMVEADTSPDLVSKAGVKGFPTMILTKADGTSVEYKGDRSVSGWEEWLSSNL
jgi:thiol-disulfide isomerase/thioredoxin